MKSLFLVFIISFFVFSCKTTQVPSQNSSENENTLKFEKNEEDEYDIIVLDTGYDSYLNSIAQPKNFYSESYYKNKNRFYVMEWNLRNSQPMVYDPDFYSVKIDYDPNVEYGLNLEYKLYNYFQFIKWKYKINLDIGR